MKPTWTRAGRAFLLASAVAFLYAMSLPAASSAAASKTITISPAGAPSIGNCYPFGLAGDGNTWTPFMAFISKNIPAFELKPGDTLAFDTNVVNDVDVQLDVALAAATTNGSDVPGQPFATLATNTQTPANPRGNTVIGDFELQFVAQAPFSFSGGGLIIRFSNPSTAYLADVMCSGAVVGAIAADTSGFFVERAYTDPDGTSPWSFSDGGNIGAFRVILLPTSNTFSFGKVGRNKHRGTATLAIDIPGPGTLALTGKGVKTQRTARDAAASMAVTAAGTVNLPIKPKAKVKKRLRKRHKAKVNVGVTFTPSGDPAGDPNTQTKRVKLIKKLG
jgi:hypothetical protein